MNVHRTRILIILLSSFLLLSCGTTIKPIDVTVTAIERAPLILPDVDRISPDLVIWTIISEETAGERFIELKEKGYDPVLFGVTDEGYKNLAVNQKKIMNLISQQRAVIKAYEDYYEGTKDGTDGTDRSE